jgi:hypothetical protein
LEFVQNATKEAFDAMVRGLIGETWSTVTPYSLIGIERASAISGTITSGYISFEQEVYFFAGIANYNTFVNSGVFLITETDATAPYNPITFTDGTPRNPAKVRRVTLVDQVNGTGSFNYTSIVYLNRRIVNSTSAAYLTTTSGKEAVSGCLFTSKFSGARKYKITFTGTASFTTSAATQGCTLTIEQVTGAVVLGRQFVGFTTSIGTVNIPFTCGCLNTSLPAGQTIRGYIQRSGTNNVDLADIVFSVEEYL